MESMVIRAVLLMAAIVGACSTAMARETKPFAGPYAGLEIGAHEHHFYLEVDDVRTGGTQGRYFRAWGIGGGAFAGYDLPVSDRWRLGAEATLSLGGATDRFTLGSASYAQRPRYGYRVVGRAGYRAGERVMVYGSLGYGGHRYQIVDTIAVDDARPFQQSFVIGGGVEYRASPRIGVRLDFKHLDNSMSHILVGVPIRF